MLNQKRSGSLARLKYLAVIPIGMGLLCMSTLAFSKTYGWINILPANNHLAIKQSATKNPDTTVLVKLSADKRIPPPPPPARPKKVKSADVVTVTDVKLSELPKNVKPADVVKLRLSDPARLTASNKSGDMVTKTDVKLAQAASPSSNIQSEMNNARSNAEKSVHQKMPPPPMAPFKSPANKFDQLSKYSARSIKYPASARKSKLVGSVIVKFDVTDDHKITGVNLVKGIGSGCDEEVTRVLRAYTGEVNTRPGNYKLAVTFILNGITAPKPASEDLFNDPSFAGEIVVEGHPSK